MFNIPKKMNISLKPTPLYKMKSISEDLGCNIYIKRDDLLGVGFGGNKIRKLEYLLKDAIDNGYKTIVTSGSLQTNHGMLTAIMSKMIGINCILFLLIENNEEKVLSGNLLLDDYIGCDIELIDVVDIMSNENLTTEEKDNLVSNRLNEEIKKKIPCYCKKYNFKESEIYKIVSAGSMPIGVFGYVECMKEIYEQKEVNKFDYVFCGNGSGGTYAGMLLGNEYYFNGEQNIIGVNIEEMSKEKPKFISDIVKKASYIAKNEEVEIYDKLTFLNDSIGNGYAIPDDETMKTIEYFSRNEGFFLDPVYTGKIFNGTLKYIKDNLQNSGKNILILHSGGTTGIFNHIMKKYREDNSELIKRWKNDIC